MLRRSMTGPLRDALADRPVVLIHGPRQTGKSTLARTAAPDARYLTLDDATVAAAAIRDPQGFVEALDGPTTLDEVQRVPALFTAIKASVDRDRHPGRFLLTGSANVLLLPRLSESLAGRMEIITVLPLSQGEIEGRTERFIDAAFGKRLAIPAAPKSDRRSLTDRLLTGGYPEVVTSIAPPRRPAWFSSYLTAILQRDARDLANIEDLTALPRLMALLASRSAGLLNFADLARALAMPQTTLKRYFALLETTFLVRLVPPWSANQGLRLVKSPKLYLTDTGLAAHLLNASPDRLRREGTLLGSLLETFVAGELAKQLSWSERQPSLLHFRTQAGREVDLVLEDRSGALVGVEVKAAASVGDDDFKGLRALADAAGPRFVRGIVLYTGREHVAFGKDLHAVPLTALWTV